MSPEYSFLKVPEACLKQKTGSCNSCPVITLISALSGNNHGPHKTKAARENTRGICPDGLSPDLSIIQKSILKNHQIPIII